MKSILQGSFLGIGFAWLITEIPLTDTRFLLYIGVIFLFNLIVLKEENEKKIQSNK